MGENELEEHYRVMKMLDTMSITAQSLSVSGAPVVMVSYKEMKKTACRLRDSWLKGWWRLIFIWTRRVLTAFPILFKSSKNIKEGKTYVTTCPGLFPPSPWDSWAPPRPECRKSADGWMDGWEKKFLIIVSFSFLYSVTKALTTVCVRRHNKSTDNLQRKQVQTCHVVES